MCAAIVLPIVLAAACTGRREQVSATVASAGVSRYLYEMNLLSDPEVNAKNNEFVLAVTRDHVDHDVVMPAFYDWLSRWAREHPDRVRAAREAGRPAGVEHRAGGR